MAINKKLATLGAIGVVGVSSLGIAGVSSAATNTASGPDDLINKIATKFNLNKDEVKKVFDEEHQARIAERQKESSDRLQKLVDDKKITAEQKTKIEAKFAEIDKQRDANRDSMKSLTDDQRKQKMDSERADLEKWAKDNGIDLNVVRPERGRGGPGDRGGDHGQGGGTSTATTSTNQ